MANITTLVAYDGASTPVAHSLYAVGLSQEGKKEVATWRENNVAVPKDAQVRTMLMYETLKSGIIAVSRRTVVPVMESVSGQNSNGYTAAPKVAFEDTFVTTGFFSPRSSVNSRRLCYQLHLNLLGGISTSVAVNTTGVDADLFHSLFMPT